VCRVFQERLHHPWGLGLPEKKYYFRFANDFWAIFILFYPFDGQMCDTEEDGEARKPAREQFGLYNGSSTMSGLHSSLFRGRVTWSSWILLVTYFVMKLITYGSGSSLSYLVSWSAITSGITRLSLITLTKTFPVTVVFPIGAKSK